MTIEIANVIRGGRAVGTEYVVTRRENGQSAILARFATRDEAVAYMDDWAVMDDRDTWDTELERS